MVVEVILAQIGEDRHIEGNGIRPSLLQPLRRYLENHSRAPVLPHAAQNLLQLDRTGRGEIGHLLFRTIVKDHRSDQASSLHRLFQDSVDEKGRSGLAVRPGHSRHPQIGGRVPAPHAGQEAQSLARIGHQHPAHAFGKI